MSKSKLKKAPLKEVIFELHWECSIDANGMPTDLGFELAQGKLNEKLKSDFPLHRRLAPNGMLINPFGIPIHQYWKGEFQWPVIQHGQGILSINETEKEYEWEEKYRPLIIKVVDKLKESYDSPLKFNRVVLQYIDGWDLENQPAIEFAKQNLRTHVKTDFSTPGTLKGFNVQQSFELPDESILTLNLANARNNQTEENAIILITTVEKNAPVGINDLTKWIDTAHEQTSSIFKNMLEPEFYASLDR